MTPLEELLQRRWILKSENSELYYKVKDSLKDIRKIMQEKLGYIIIVNPYLIKLEKIPGKAEPWMGIQEFRNKREYQMLCYLIMFLDDKERESQFMLSSITEFIQAQFPSGEIEWTNLVARRQIIRVLKYAITIGLMLHYGDDEDRFAQDEHTQVLYENTGISRYFMRNFMKEIMDYEAPQEFEESEWIAMDEDRGIVRRQRIYRRLLLSPGVYRSDEDDDFLYIRNYRNQIQNDFQAFFPCDLHIHKSSAYVNLMEDCSMRSVFPSRNALSDMILLLHYVLQKRIKNNHLHIDKQEQLHMEYNELIRICEKTLKQHLEKFPKKYQDEGIERVVQMVLETMQMYGFIEIHPHDKMLTVYPVIGKLVGNYVGRE